MSEGSASHARLLRNRGADAPGHFLDVTVEAGVVLDDVRSRNLGGFARDPLITRTDEPGPKGPFAFASAFADLDGDGWPDLAVASDYGMTRIFWNNGDGTFTDGTVEASIGSDRNGMGSTFGDYDGDGDLDWFVSSIFAEYEQCESLSGCGTWDSTGNRLYRNDGGRSFSDATDEAGVRDGGWGWGSVFFDFDNDGDLDLAMVGGMHHSATFSDRALDSPTLWENDGTGRMTDVSEAVGLTHPDASKGFLTFDYDNDGRPRLVCGQQRGSAAPLSQRWRQREPVAASASDRRYVEPLGDWRSTDRDSDSRRRVAASGGGGAEPFSRSERGGGALWPGRRRHGCGSGFHHLAGHGARHRAPRRARRRDHHRAGRAQRLRDSSDRRSQLNDL